ncbi:MAG TPA: hypothetical protein PLR99_15020 [Polyangiaceae bacterium]|nr:hypothetical protein [Polyangiaceae bacterium]
MKTRPLALAAAATLAFALSLLPGCSKDKPQFADAAAQAEKKLEEKKALGDNAPKEVEGKKLNAFFPETLEGGKRTFTTEKPGYVEAKYQKDGADLCTVTIADLVDNADSKDKYAKSTEKVAGYPVTTFGKKQSMLLVKDRYQVKIISDTLTHDQRKALLEKVDLKGVAGL